MSDTESDVQKKNGPWAWVRTALVGIGICGLIGPLLPVLVWMPVEIFRDRHSILDALKALVLSFYMWPFAVIFMGPPGALFGAFGALWIRFRSRKLNPKQLWMEAALAGLLLGIAVPLSMYILAKSPDRDSFTMFIPMGIGSGTACGLLAFLTLRRLGLLLGHADSN